MSDLPANGLLQQLNARSISGEHLEVLGKKAAALWCEGRAETLNSAVVETVKHAGLSPEQVKRVVEFANTDAYLTEFRKEGSPSKFVDFGAGGPADPSVVLQDLNDGGGGSVFDPGDNSFFHPPKETSKTASSRAEAAFEQMFSSTGLEYPEENPLGEVIDLRDKLASAYETATSELSTLENMFFDLKNQIFHHVKQASLSGHSLSEVAEIWSRYAPTEEHVKVAFQAVFGPLVENGVFRSSEEVVDSLTKNASVGIVNEEHPLVVDFKDFCEVLSKLAEVREMQQETGEGVARLTAFLKHAEDDRGFLQRAGDLLDSAGDAAGRGGERLGELLLGKGRGKALGTAARFGTKYVLPAVAVNEVYRRTLKHNPAFQKAKQTALSVVPGTDEYYKKDLELEMQHGGAGYPPGMM